MEQPINNAMKEEAKVENLHEKAVYISEDDYSYMCTKVIHLTLSLTILLLAGIALLVFLLTFYLYPKALSKSLNEVYLEEWEKRISDTPILASYYNLPGNFSYKLDNYSLSTFEQNYLWYSQFYNDSYSYLHRGKHELSGYDYYHSLIFYEYLYNKIKVNEHKVYLFNFDQNHGLHIDLIDKIVPEHLETLEEYEDYIKRLEKLPELINQQIELLKYGNSLNYKNPTILMKYVPYQIDYLIKKNDTFLYPFKEFPEEIPEITRETLKKTSFNLVNNYLVPALSKLYQFIKNEYQTRSSISIYDIPQGESLYKHYLNYYSETPYTPDQIHSLGESLVANITIQMNNFLKENSINQNLAEFINSIKNDTRFYLNSEKEYLSLMRENAKKVDPKFVKIISTFPRCPYGIESLSSRKGPFGVLGVFEKPKYQCHSPAVYHYNTYSLSHPTYHQEALSLMNIFGRYLQTSFATEIDPTYPLFRTFSDFPSFEDGWTLYAISLGEKIGFYKDIYQKFGRLSIDMLAACKLVIDTGIHHKKWTREQAINYLRKTALSQFEIENQVDYCISFPGRCISEKFGEIVIKDLKKKVELASKEKHVPFNLKKFHYEVLKNGPLPLHALEDSIEEYIHNLDKTEEHSGH